MLPGTREGRTTKRTRWARRVMRKRIREMM
jgi:hypothetical protein